MVNGKPQFKSPIEMLQSAVKTHGDSCAFVSCDHTITYNQFFQAVAALAATLPAAPQTIAIALPSSVEFCLGVFAAWLGGHKVSLHNVMQPEAALKKQFGLISPNIILTNEDNAGVMESAAPDTSIQTVDKALAQQLPCEELIGLAAPSNDTASTVLYLFTGGTTGVPKAVEHSFASVMAAVEGMEYAWPTETGKETWLSVSPMFHVYGFLFCVLNPVYSKAANVMGYPFHTDSCITAMTKHKITVLSGGPPAVYAALLSNADFNEETFKHLKICAGGGAPFSIEFLDVWVERTGVPITEAYGMTEMAPITANSLDKGNRQGSVGKAGLAVEITIRNHDTREKLGAGETGDVFVKSPQGMLGYYQNPEETKVVLKDCWLETGDVGYLDKDGFLFLTGRTKEMINVSGFKVYPREIDDCLVQHPAVQEACTVGLPDSRTGETVASCIVLKPDAVSDELAIKAYCTQELVNYKRPSNVYILEAIPKTSANKQDRQTLINTLTDFRALEQVADCNGAAKAIIHARQTGQVIKPISDSFHIHSLDDGYKVQQKVAEFYHEEGRQQLGHKIGLTSVAVQTQLGVDTPDFGTLYSDMAYMSGARVPANRLIQPKAEAEIAFMLSRDITAPISIEELPVYIEYACAAIEIVDSIIENWKLSIADTVGDNASCGLYVLSADKCQLDDIDLRLCGMVMNVNEKAVSHGVGAACLGHPLNAVKWLVNALLERGKPLKAGELILSGALGPMHAVKKGDHVKAEIAGFSPVEFTLE